CAAFPRYNRTVSPQFMTKDASRLVLVVEDDLSVRRPLVKFLEMHGFAVVTAETSDEGLDALKQHKLTAAVVDLRLRRGSGRDVERRVPVHEIERSEEARVGDDLHHHVRLAIVETSFDRRAHAGRNRRIADVHVERYVDACRAAAGEAHRLLDDRGDALAIDV